MHHEDPRPHVSNGPPPLKVVFIIIFFSQFICLLSLYCYAKTVWGGTCLTHQKGNQRISFSNVVLTGLSGVIIGHDHGVKGMNSLGE